MGWRSRPRGPNRAHPSPISTSSNGPQYRSSSVFSLSVPFLRIINTQPPNLISLPLSDAQKNLCFADALSSSPLILPEEPPVAAAQGFVVGEISSAEEAKMMSRCGYEQSAMVGCEGMDSIVCPKPRRLSFLTPSFNDNIRPFRYFNHNQSEIGDSDAGSEILDIILTKGNRDDRFSTNQLVSSPPFFCGSPPSRASNPVIQDEHFGNSSNMAPFSPTQPMLSSRNGGCVRMKSGDKPVAVRIEGFDCLSRDRRNCSISAVA